MEAHSPTAQSAGTRNTCEHRGSRYALSVPFYSPALLLNTGDTMRSCTLAIIAWHHLQDALGPLHYTTYRPRRSSRWFNLSGSRADTRCFDLTSSNRERDLVRIAQDPALPELRKTSTQTKLSSGRRRHRRQFHPPQQRAG